MRSLSVFLCALPLLGQSIRVSSGSAAPGEKLAIEIALDSPSGKEPLALQWEATFSGEALKLDGTGPVAGPAARAAGKGLTCAPKKTSPGPSKWVCILAGGQKPIGNGVVALLRFEVQAHARSGSQPIVVVNLLGASAALKKAPILRAEGAVSVTRWESGLLRDARGNRSEPFWQAGCNDRCGRIPFVIAKGGGHAHSAGLLRLIRYRSRSPEPVQTCLKRRRDAQRFKYRCRGMLPPHRDAGCGPVRELGRTSFSRRAADRPRARHAGHPKYIWDVFHPGMGG